MALAGESETTRILASGRGAQISEIQTRRSGLGRRIGEMLEASTTNGIGTLAISPTNRLWGAKSQSTAAPRRPSARHLWGTITALLILIVGPSLFFFRDSGFRRSEHIVLSLQGSTSLGDELMPQLAAAFLRDEMGAVQTGFTIAGRDAKGRSFLHVWGKVPGKSGLQVIEIYASGSSLAFECLAEHSAHSCDIGMASRPITNLDTNTYPALRNLDDRAGEHVVALDGIAIVVNPHNRVSQLSVSQLRAIYTGQITNWKALGGSNARIEVYGRDQDSGTFEMFTEKVMGIDSPVKVHASAVTLDHQIADSGLLVDAVMHSPNAIGYVSSPLVKQAKALAVSDGRGPAFLPTQLSIVTEDYPICRRLLLYDRESPGSLSDRFIHYAVYNPGQTLATQTPFVDLTPRIFPVVPPRRAPRAYKDIASKYSQIGLSLHFLSEQEKPATHANMQLDNLARVNVLRLRTFLAQRGETGDDILLLGFADSQETGRESHNRAKMRAESVSMSLRSVGVVVPDQNIRDFGTHLPVASNESPEGRRKNRRVEVWVRNQLQ